MKSVPVAIASAAALLCVQTALAQDLSHRKADLTVEVQSASGTPLPGAQVQIEMLNHAFRFGCAVEHRLIDPNSNDFDPFTVEQLQKYFNSTTYGNIMKWTYYEARTDEQNLAIAALPQSFNAFDGPDKLRLRGHSTIWGAEYQVPSRVRSSNDGAYISQQILNHAEAYHTTYKDAGIDNFDLYNEHFNARDLLIEKIVTSDNMAEEAAEVAKWFNKAKEADPDAVLFINEFNILNFWNASDANVINYKNFVDAIRDAGGQIDGIGLQGHMDRPTTTKADVIRRLNILAADMPPTENYPEGLPGLRLEITELDMAIKNEIHNADWVGWTNATMEQQVAVTRAVFEGAFEHPSVDGITIWGLDDFTHWRGNAIMFDNLAEGSTPNNRIAQDPVLKETGQYYIDTVLGEWWEDHSGASSSSGEYTANTFKGTHRVAVTLNGQTQEKIVHLDEADTVAFEFVAEAADASTYDAWAAFIDWGVVDPTADADPDGDGRSNFEEFVAGTDPLAWDHASSPTLLDVHSGQAQLRFTHRAVDQNLIVSIQKSDDLTPDSWQIVTLPDSAVQKVVENGFATYSASLPTPFEPAFYRIRIAPLAPANE